MRVSKDVVRNTHELAILLDQLCGLGGWLAFSDPRVGRAGNRPPNDGRVELAEEVAQAFLPVFFLPALGQTLAKVVESAMSLIASGSGGLFFWNCRACSDRPSLN